jgi:hypothetical protein
VRTNKQQTRNQKKLFHNFNTHGATFNQVF